MGKVTGFLEIERQDRGYDKPEARMENYREFVHPLPYGEVGKQAARCMDCGIPFCHQGCPVNNHDSRLEQSGLSRPVARPRSRCCTPPTIFPNSPAGSAPRPAKPLAPSTSRTIPVTIKTIECQIVDRAWEEGWIQPVIAPKKTGKTVAVVGSGRPAWPAAQQLARAGHSVTLFEKATASAACCATAFPTSRWKSI